MSTEEASEDQRSRASLEEEKGGEGKGRGEEGRGGEGRGRERRGGERGNLLYSTVCTPKMI